MKLGIHRGLTDAEYFAIPAMNFHLLKEIDRSPKHLKAAMEAERAPTAAMQMGTAVHSAVLLNEPVHVEAPKFDRRTKAGKEAAAEFELQAAGKIVLKPEEAQAVDGMVDALRADDAWQMLAQDGDGEVVLIWEHPGHGFLCKAKVDWLPAAHKCLIDVKTCQDASPRGFRLALEKFGYACQAAWYLQGAQQCGIDADAFVFACVESSAPFATALYSPDSETMHRAGIKIADWAERYAHVLDTGSWEGYPRGVQMISARPWAFD